MTILTNAWPLPTNVSPEFDCGMRKAAFAYGKKLIPRQGEFESLYYALDLNNESCKVELPSVKSTSSSTKKQKEDITTTSISSFPKNTIFVSPVGNDDSNDGSESKPFQSIQHAIDKAAEINSKLVVLHEGTYYLQETIMFTPKHSDIEIITHPLNTKDTVISGGILLKNVVWKHYPTTHTKNVYVTNVKEFVKDSKASTPVPGLQINGKRRTRARYPNLPGGIEVSPMYDNMISGGDATWTPPDFNKYGKVKFYTDNTTAHQRPGKLYIYIYIYIHKNKHIHTYIHIYIYIYKNCCGRNSNKLNQLCCCIITSIEETYRYYPKLFNFFHHIN